MSDVKPGEKVTLQVERAGSEQTVEVGTKASDDNPPRAIMGILIEPKLDLPVDITIDTGQIGGPSAGLAFALDIIDELGPTDIDHGETGRRDRRDRPGRNGARDRRDRAENRRRTRRGRRRLPRSRRQRGGRAQVRGRASHRPGIGPRRGVARSGNTIVAASGNGCNVLGGNCGSLVNKALQTEPERAYSRAFGT